MLTSLQESEPDRLAMHQFSEVLKGCIKDVSSPLPLAATREAGAEGMLECLAAVHLSSAELRKREVVLNNDQGGPFRPNQFVKISGPDWLGIDRYSGKIFEVDPPQWLKADDIAVSVEIASMGEDKAAMDLTLSPSKSAMPSSVEAVLARIMDTARQQPSAL